MWPYWLLFFIPAFRAFRAVRVLARYPKTLNAPLDKKSFLYGWWLVIFVFLILIIGLRHEVGADWFNYLEFIDNVKNVSLNEALSFGDPAYNLLNWIAAETKLGVYFVNIVCATLFSWGLLTFCRIQPRSWLALTVAVPYLIIVVAMGYSRQGVAIGLAMLGLVALDKGRVLPFLLWIALAATFHKSVFILIPLAILSVTRYWVWTLLWLTISCSLLLFFLIQEGVGGFTALYIDGAMESSGAIIRIAMNALPAFLFLFLKKNFKLEPMQRIFWTWMALGAILFIVLLKFSPSSTAVDRLALYWIPFQLFFWSRLPDALGRTVVMKVVWVFAVVAYSALILFIWMNFAANSGSWLPYSFYPTI